MINRSNHIGTPIISNCPGNSKREFLCMFFAQKRSLPTGNWLGSYGTLIISACPGNSKRELLCMFFAQKFSLPTRNWLGGHGTPIKKGFSI